MDDNSLYALNLEITTQCNLLCKHCGIDHCSANNQIDNDKELSYNDYTDIVLQALKLGCKHILIAGGEPLLCDFLWNLCDFINEQQISFAILTNGTLINEECCLKLKDYKYLSYVRISMDYISDEKFSDFRGIKDLKQIVISSIMLLREHGIRTGIGMTIMNDNLQDIKHIMKLANQLGANFFRAIPVAAIGRAKDMNVDQEFYTNALVNVMEAAEEVQSIYFSTILLPENLSELDSNVLIECPAGKSTLSIDSCGNVKSCVLESKSVESLKTHSLEDIYNRIVKTTNEQNQEVILSGCKECSDKNICKGGCHIERELGKTNEQLENPICIKTIWQNAHKILNPSKDLRRLVNNMMCIYNTQVYYKIPMCYRSLPLWWYPLDGNKKLIEEVL